MYLFIFGIYEPEVLVCVGEDVKDEGGAVLQVQLWALAQLHHLWTASSSLHINMFVSSI